MAKMAPALADAPDPAHSGRLHTSPKWPVKARAAAGSRFSSRSGRAWIVPPARLWVVVVFLLAPYVLVFNSRPLGWERLMHEKRRVPCEG